MKIAYIGTGIMGAPMALHLLNGGHEVYVIRHRQAIKAELLAAGAIVCESLPELATQVDIICTNVPKTEDVEAVLLGPQGIIHHAKPGTCVLDFSTISAAATRRIAEQLAARGIDFLDCPVSGGDVGAQAASLSIMCGGQQAVFDKVKPILQLLGQNINLVGDHGAGQITKACNQIIVGLNMEAVAEAMSFAQRAGVDPEKVCAAITGGFATSRVLEVHSPKILSDKYKPGFKLALHHKDMNMVLQQAEEMDLPLPNAEFVMHLMNDCLAHEEGECDSSVIARALRRMQTDA